jgi:hypothetical protein
VTAYTIVSLLLIVGTAILLSVLVAFGVAIASAMIYSAWTPYLVRGLELSAERMSDK